MEEGPFAFIEKGKFHSLSGLYYRFHDAKEIIGLFLKLKEIYRRFGSIEALLEYHYDGDIRMTLKKIREGLFSDRTLLFFFPDPSKEHPLKRWNLYLRWMVRKDEIDLGIFTFMDKKELVVPLDTHLFKIGKCLGWTKRKSPSFSAALEITQVFKEFSPSDPLLFDFFLCHRVGIQNSCPGEKSKNCEGRCILYEV